MKAIFRLLLVVFLLGGALLGAEELSDPVTFSLVAEENPVQPGYTFLVALHVKIEPHWHINWKDPAGVGMPLSVSWTAPEGFEVGEISWPAPQRFAMGSSGGYGYENEAILLVPVKTSQDFTSGETSLAADIRWVVCDDSSCLPGESHAELKVTAGQTVGNTAKIAFFQAAKDRIDAQGPSLIAERDPLQIDSYPPPEDFEFHGGVLLAIGLAFIGGMILNLMPCVLPVISFKILGFIKLAGESRRLIFQHGLAFCIGVLLSFWVLAGALLILQGYGKSVGWGFQLQEPMFVMVLASFVFIFGLSLFGVFEMGTSLMGLVSNSNSGIGNKRSELLSSFFSGIMATAVATPCTGPFLGSAVGFAVTLPPIQAMAVFTSIGVGMSFPYMALAAFPSLLRYMPKQGPWMETFKQVMGFMMVATTVWLIWVFGAQMGVFSITLLLSALFFFSVACWIYGRWGTPVQGARVRVTGQVFAALIFAVGAYTAYTSATPWAEAMSGAQVELSSADAHIAGEWEPFSRERVEELRKQGKPVFIDFTAKWCLICQANHLVLSMEEVAKEFAERGIVRMKADWTKRDDIIAAELKKLGRNSVPVYVLYNGDEEATPQILPQVLTKDIVIESLGKIEP